jgi:hypothetical protein
MGAMAYMVYPALAAAAQWVTGNKNADVARRGSSVIPYALSQVAQGDKTGKDVSSVLPYLFTPSMPINTAFGALKNQDFTGNKIIPARDYTQPKNIGKAAVEEADYAARNLVSPYNTIAAGMSKPNASPMTVAQKFLEELVGIKEPSPGTEKYLSHMPRNVTQTEKRQAKKAGPMEQGYNWLTK